MLLNAEFTTCELLKPDSKERIKTYIRVVVFRTKRGRFSFSRGKAAQVHRLREGVLAELEPDHPLEEAHGVQAVRVRPLRKGLPEEGRPEEAQGDAAHRTEADGDHLVRGAVPAAPLSYRRRRQGGRGQHPVHPVPRTAVRIEAVTISVMRDGSFLQFVTFRAIVF